MHRVCLTLVAAAALAAIVSPATAEAYNFTTINIPGETSLMPQSINASGQVVGAYTNAFGVSFGFLDTAGTITTINVGGQNGTDAVSINDSGVIAGYYNLSSGSTAGFTDSSTHVVTEFTVPTTYKASGTVPVATNAGAQVTGYYVVKSSGNYLGFVDTGGSFTSINSGDKYTIPAAINAAGEVVGTYSGSNGIPSGFTFSGGTFTHLPNPDALPTAINNSGTITGILDEGAFVDVAGTITPFSAGPTAVSTNPTAINAGGAIVGYYVDGSNNDNGFVDNAGVITTVDIPGAVDTEINAINAAGTITGYYTDSLGNLYGFIGTQQSVPEPGSVAVLLTALGGLGFVRASRARA
jgi:hypothetical protein